MSNKVEVLVRLFETIEKRSMDDPSQSYTAQLLSEGKEKCIAKLKEESLETIEAAEKEEISQIIYGEVFTGSIVISSGIDTVQVEGTAT